MKAFKNEVPRRGNAVHKKRISLGAGKMKTDERFQRWGIELIGDEEEAMEK
uniref:Uncharacterized protein n=1 Tax=Cucumis melo TaxID=3656 RepID=A0A9I9DRI9_CUCME